MTPLTFEVRAVDGRLLDRFREDELACYATQPEKSWHEAACWAHLAILADRPRLLDRLDDKDGQLAVPLRIDHADHPEASPSSLLDDVSRLHVGDGERDDAVALTVGADQGEPEHGSGGYR